MRLAAVAVALLALTACSDSNGGPSAAAGQTCSSYSGGIPGSRAGMLAYYRPGGYPVLFSQGGDEPSTATAFATWIWRCGWTQAAGPDPNVWGYAMAYDPDLHETILVGVKTLGWNGLLWQDLHVAPPLNLGVMSMVFDEAHHVLVLTDAYRAGLNTWTFDGGAWRKASTSGPANAAGAALAYDPRSRAVLLFGAPPGAIDDETWSWDGSAWHQLQPATSPPSGEAVMAFDEATRQMILVNWDQTTWEWTGATWRRLDVAAPNYNSTARMVYDSAHGRLFYWVSGAVWTYAGSWRQDLSL